MAEAEAREVIEAIAEWKSGIVMHSAAACDEAYLASIKK